MTGPVEVTRGGHRTHLKWHRARRRAADPVFTGRRILEGMRLGASVEVDLVRHAGAGFAVLHDHRSIARETTGEGAAASLPGDRLRALHLRDNAGVPIADHVMLLDDLCALLVQTPPHPDALLQLDYKEGQERLDAPTVAAFARAVGPVAGHMIVSSGEADSVARLAAATRGIHVGYDPCHGEAIALLTRTRDFAGFAAAAIADSPQAEMIYLGYPLVLEAEAAGFDIVAAFRAASRRVDAYTIKAAGEASRPVVERLLALRVDQITTDDPEGLADMLGRDDAGDL